MALPENWRVAGSIQQLHRQLRPLAPNADPRSFGTVANAAHGTNTDHYPKVYAALGARPVVCAADFPNAQHLDSHAVLETIRRSQDPRVKYGISRGRMFSSYPAHGYAPWAWRPYSGDDGHFTHGHLSVLPTARADDTTPWTIGVTDMALTDVHGLYLKLLYENWAPSKDEWVRAGGSPTLYDLLGANGSSRNGLALALAKLQTSVDHAATKALVTDAGDEARDNATLTAINALAAVIQAGGGNVDTIAITGAINALRADATAAANALGAQLVEARDRIAELETELARTRAAVEVGLSDAERDTLSE